MREHLASRELYVAEFYARKGNHQATRTRAGNLLVTYPETQAAVDAMAVVASDARSAGDDDVAQLADAAYTEASANPETTPSRTQGGAGLALRNRIAPNAVASPITPLAPPSSGKTAKPKQ